MSCASTGAAGRSAQRLCEEPEHREREEPPGGKVFVHEQRAESQCEDESGRDPPVVADDELPPEAGEQLDLPHRCAPSGSNRACCRRSRRTSASDDRATKPRIPRSASSPPGHDTPVPSAAQKIPNVVSMIPTANFNVFSGTRLRGARP